MVAAFALAGVALAVIGADTTVTDATGAAPIVDDASRQDPVRHEQSTEVADEGPSSGPGAGAEARAERCADITAAPGTAAGCSPPTLRGPPGG